MDPGILVKNFSSFVPNVVLNIEQAFLIILKDKQLWSMPMFIENTTSKHKNGGLKSCTFYSKFLEHGHP